VPAIPSVLVTPSPGATALRRGCIDDESYRSQHVADQRGIGHQPRSGPRCPRLDHLVSSRWVEPAAHREVWRGKAVRREVEWSQNGWRAKCRLPRRSAGGVDAHRWLLHLAARMHEVQTGCGEGAVNEGAHALDVRSQRPCYGGGSGEAHAEDGFLPQRSHTAAIIGFPPCKWPAGSTVFDGGEPRRTGKS